MKAIPNSLAKKSYARFCVSPNHIKKTLFLTAALALACCAVETKAQEKTPIVTGKLAIGSTAPDWTFMDLNGKSQNLYSYLGQGKTVVIYIMASWCAPCWTYHIGGSLKKFYNLYGPPGTKQAMVFYIEGDIKSEDACLTSGAGPCPTGTTTEGGWKQTTPVPICNPTASTAFTTFKNKYDDGSYPTTYVICPNKKVKANNKTDYKAAMDACNGVTVVAETDMDAYVSVYPNPSSGNVFVDLNAMDGIGRFNIKVYNALGEMVWKMNEKNSAPAELELDLNKQPNGLYFIEVISEKAQTIKKIMINR